MNNFSKVDPVYIARENFRNTQETYSTQGFSSYDMRIYKDELQQLHKIENDKTRIAQLEKPARCLGVYTKPDKTIILQANCQYADKDKEHYLIIESCWVHIRKTINFIGEFILENIPTPTYQYGTYFNTKRLQFKTNKNLSVIDFEELPDSEMKLVIEMYQELVISEKLILIANIDLTDRYTIECLNIIIYAYLQRLCGKLNAEYKPFGNQVMGQPGITGSYKKPVK